MNTDELTQITTAHHTIISRHDVEMAEIRATLNTVSHKLDQVADQFNQVADQQTANAQQIALNRQDIASLSAGILDLRNLVADHLQGRADD